MSKLIKYPRTYHLPWSPGTTSEDRILVSTNHFTGKEIVVTEKLDGENTTMYCDHIHARSRDSRNHPSRNLVKGIWGSIKHEIPKDWRVCGENMYAKHSIPYTKLTSYFYVFGVYDACNVCLSWQETKEFTHLLGLETVPELYLGLWDEELLKNLYNNMTSAFGDTPEGFVVRTTEGFSYYTFAEHVAKFVRKHHVQTSQFWMNEIIVPNLLA